MAQTCFRSLPQPSSRLDCDIEPGKLCLTCGFLCNALQEDREHQKLVVSCRCGYQEDVDPSRWCVYRNEVHHTSKERTVILRVSPHTESRIWQGCCRAPRAWRSAPPVHLETIQGTGCLVDLC
jgi:hypothetical protein